MPLSNYRPANSGPAPVKLFATSGDLAGGTADFTGQILTLNDGSALAVAGSTSAGGGTLSMTMLNSPIFTGDFSPARIDQNGPEGFGANWLGVSGSTDLPCVLALLNETAGPSALALVRRRDDAAPSALVGLNPASEDGVGVLQIICQPATSDADPPDLQFVQRNNGTFVPHVRLQLEGAAGALTAYGWTDSSPMGGVGWQVASDGRVGIGTMDLEADCQLTLRGGTDRQVAIHTTQVRLTSPTSAPPVIIGTGELDLRTDDSVSGIYLRTGSGTTEYCAGAGTASLRQGHRFLTGSSPQNRLSIADDAVILDVPLLPLSCTPSSLPVASAVPGGLIMVVTDGGATTALAYSDGTNWVRLAAGDVVS